MASRANGTEAEIENVLRTAWFNVLETDQMDDPGNFFSLGGDSLAAIELMENVEEELSISFPLDVLFSTGQFEAVLRRCIELAERKS